MCCEECYKYEECEATDNLKDKCCPKCEDYDGCINRLNKDEDDDHKDFLPDDEDV